MADYKWPAAENRSLIGKRISRLDGPVKSSGRAKYSFDVNRPGMLYGKMILSPYAHAKVTKIDISAAEKMPGVKAVTLIWEVGKEVQWAGQEIAAVAAETEDQARDAARAIKIEYEVLPHLVTDATPEVAGADHSKQLSEQKTGDPDPAFAQATGSG